MRATGDGNDPRGDLARGQACPGIGFAGMTPRFCRSAVPCSAAGWRTPISSRDPPASASVSSPSSWPSRCSASRPPSSWLDPRSSGFAIAAPPASRSKRERIPTFFRACDPEDKHEFPTELMAELCAAFALKPARGRGKVVLIDDADDLNQESANCFLKTLEEPPPRSVLILIGSTPDRQLPTIVSRCQVMRFAPLSGTTVDDVLKQNGVDDAALRQRLVNLSGGSPGFALALADPALLDFRRRLLDSVASPHFDLGGIGEGVDRVRHGCGEGDGGPARPDTVAAAAAPRLSDGRPDREPGRRPAGPSRPTGRLWKRSPGGRQQIV